MCVCVLFVCECVCLFLIGGCAFCFVSTYSITFRCFVIVKCVQKIPTIIIIIINAPLMCQIPLCNTCWRLRSLYGSFWKLVKMVTYSVKKSECEFVCVIIWKWKLYINIKHKLTGWQELGFLCFILHHQSVSHMLQKTPEMHCYSAIFNSVF